MNHVSDENLHRHLTTAEMGRVIQALGIVYRSGGINPDWASERQVKVARRAGVFGRLPSLEDIETAIRTLGEAHNENETDALKGDPELLAIAERSYELYNAWLEDSLGA
jgi:hypothetical protein